MQSSSTNFICPSTLCPKPHLKLTRLKRKSEADPRDLWLWMRPGSIVSNISRDEATIETPKFSAFLGSQDCNVRLHFLGYRRSAVGRQGSHYHRSLLCWFSETATEENQADSAWIADKRGALPLGQCTGTQVHSSHGCYPEMWIPTCRRPTLFSWFGSLWLLPLPENEKGARWSSFCQRWWWML